MRIAPVTFLVGLLGAASAQQTQVFERVQWPIGKPAIYPGLHLADVDADGRQDLIDVGTDGLDVALGLGGFDFAPTVHTVAGASPKNLSVGHMNGDAFPDAVVQVTPGAWKVVVQLGDGLGAFTPAGSLPVVNLTRDTLLAEVTGDGLDDLLVLTQQGGSVLLVCASDGSGGLATPVVSAANGGSRLLLGDVVEDGIPDVVVAHDLGNCISGMVTYSTLQGGGAGHFSLVSSACLAGGAGSNSLGDIDGDGHLDLLGNGPLGTTSYDVHAFLGAGDGSFTTDVVVGNGSWRPIAVDVTGDGQLDVVGQAPKVGSCTWPALGGGAFGPRRDSPLMAVDVFADLDGDGLVDAAGVNPDGPGTVVAPNRGDGTWDSALTSIPLWPSGPYDSALGDFDADGRLDVAQTGGNSQVSGVQTLQGRGDGSFELGSFATAGASPLQGVRVGDATDDGNDDVLALNSNGLAHLVVGHGDGSFEPGLKFSVPFTLATDGRFADLNGDGRTDLIESGTSPPGVGVFLGSATGGWHPLKYYPGVASATELAPVDLDQDGDLDVVASSSAFFNHGHGILAPAQQLLPGVVLGPLECADFDEDGLPDLAAVGNEPQADPDLILLLGLGDGRFGPPTLEPLPTWPGGLAVADMNRDGHADLVMLSEGRHLELRRGDGAGNFVVDRFLSPLTSFQPTFDVGDVNGDEWPDVVCTQTGGVTVLLNQLGVWHDLGYAFDKSDGVSAQLSGGGPLQAGSPVVLHLGAAGAGADVALVIGVAQDMLPFKGGVMVPSFDVLLAGLSADAQGHLVLEAAWPVALPTGTEIFFQAFVADAGAPAGLAPSNALSARAP